MNILCLTAGGDIGGSERVLLKAIMVWYNTGHHIVLVLPRRYRESPLTKLIAPYCTLRTIYGPLTIQSPTPWKRWIKRLYSPIVVAQLLWYCWREHTELLYTNTIQVTFGVILAQLTRLPHRWHIHEMPDFIPLFGFKKDIRTFFQKTMQRADVGFVCLTQRQRWEQYLGIDLSTKRVIYNPIDDAPFVTHPSSDDTIQFGYAGRFMPVKRTRELVNVFRQFHTKYPKTHLTLLGATPSDNKTEYLSDGISVYDFTSDTSNFYQTIDVFVLPSLTEVWPLTIMEAIAHGCTCICTTNTGLRELFTEQDILFTPPTNKDLYQALEHCLRVDTRTQLVRHAQQTLTDFTRKHQFTTEINRWIK